MNTQKERSAFIIKRIVDSWGQRAKIRGDLINIPLVEDKDDFLENLLPFYNHPKYQELNYQQKRNCLSCGWIIYNEKTLMIESEIVNPACKHIIDGHIVGLQTNEARLAACETMIDESYHMFIVEKANQITKMYRKLQHINYPSFYLSQAINKAYITCHKPWMKPLLQIATATATEVLISNYLSKLSTCVTIQPMNRITVSTHLHDELAHSKLFSSMLCQFYYLLPLEQQKFFSSSLGKAVSWFRDSELDLWKSVLEQLGIHNVREIIQDCKASDLNSMEIDCSDLTAVLKSNGILEDNYTYDLFADLGIL